MWGPYVAILKVDTKTMRGLVTKASATDVIGQFAWPVIASHMYGSDDLSKPKENLLYKNHFTGLTEINYTKML